MMRIAARGIDGKAKAVKSNNDGTLRCVSELSSFYGDLEYQALPVNRNDDHIVMQSNKANYGNNIRVIVSDDEYVYVAGSRADVHKYRRSDMTLVGEYKTYAATIYAMDHDDNFLYIGGAGSRNVIEKISKADMVKVSESASYGGTILNIVVDDAIYVAGQATQKVIKYNKSNMSKIAESSVYGGTIWGLAVDNDNIYIGGELTRKVFKLSKSNLSKLSESENYGGNIFSIDIDDSFIYVGGQTAGTVQKYRKSNFEKVAESDFYSGELIRNLKTSDYHILFVGRNKQLIKLDKDDLSYQSNSQTHDGELYALDVNGELAFVGGHDNHRVYKYNHILYENLYWGVK